MSTTITFRPPTDALFAGVEVHADSREGRIVGAWPAFDVEVIRDGDGNIVERIMHPLSEVPVPCNLEPGDAHLVALWLHEDSALGVLETEQTIGGGRRRLGGA